LERGGIALGLLSASGCPPAIGLDPTERPLCKSVNEGILDIVSKRRPDFVILSAKWHENPTFLSALRTTIDRMKEAGVGVVVLGESPSFNKLAPHPAAEKLLSGMPIVASMADYNFSEIVRYDRAIGSAIATTASFISVLEKICPLGNCDLVASGTKAIYFDYEHLTDVGAAYYADRLAPLILKDQKSR
jgi:hypothetical protein